jgi:hypothetical protein
MSYRPSIYSKGRVVFDTYANRPSYAEAGLVHVVSDGPVNFMHDGSEWRPLVGPNQRPHYQPPAAANWTEVGTTSGTIADEYGTLLVTSTNENALFTHNTAVGSTHTATVAFQSQWVKQGGGFEPVFALAHYESGTGKFTRFGWYIDSSGNFTMQVQRFTNRTTASTVVTSSTDNYRMNQTGHNWLRIRQNSTDVYYEFTLDGYRWITYYSEAKAAFVTATNIGLFSSNVNAATFRTQVVGFKLT